jgi:ParB/RepB/Spo0J family partition protein
MPKAKPTTAVIPAAPVLEEFPASHFERYATNRTISDEVVKNMKASILEMGIVNPLLGRTRPGNPLIEIVGGETRWLGARAIDPEYPIPVFLRELSDKEAAKLHAVDNFQRTDLDDIQQAREIQHMLDCEWTMEEIQKLLGKGKDYLYHRLRLLKLPAEGQQAVLDGNLSLHTANKIIALPEESRADAIKSVVEPTHADRALPEREAIALIQKQFVEPLERAAEWEERRGILEKENPGCEWLKYEQAIQAGDSRSDFERAESEPNFQYLSDAARHNELVVPTWGELARKHAAPIYIGFYRYNPKEVVLYVSPVAIVEAEKAAMNDNPGDCIFSHEKAVTKSRDDAERRKIEEEQRKEAVKAHNALCLAEKKKLGALILAPDGVTKTAFKKFIERCHLDCFESCYLEIDELAKLFDIADPEDWSARDEWVERVKAAVAKYLKSKSFDPAEALGRVFLAGYANSANCQPVDMFESGIAKPADFPASHEDYQKYLEKVAELARESTREDES